MKLRYSWCLAVCLLSGSTVLAQSPPQVTGGPAGAVGLPGGVLLPLQQVQYVDVPAGTIEDVPADEGACRGGVIGGVGTYIVQPYFSNNPAFSVTTAVAGAPAHVAYQDVSHHMDVAPELW